MDAPQPPSAQRTENRTYVVLGLMPRRSSEEPLRPLGTVVAQNRADARRLAAVIGWTPTPARVRVRAASLVRRACLLEALAADGRRVEPLSDGVR